MKDKIKMNRQNYNQHSNLDVRYLHWPTDQKPAHSEYIALLTIGVSVCLLHLQLGRPVTNGTWKLYSLSAISAVYNGYQPFSVKL